MKLPLRTGKFLQIKSRSGRWESVAVSPHGRGDVAGSGGTREMALAHYAVRAGLPENNYTWLKRYRGLYDRTSRLRKLGDSTQLVL